MIYVSPTVLKWVFMPSKTCVASTYLPDGEYDFTDDSELERVAQLCDVPPGAIHVQVLCYGKKFSIKTCYHGYFISPQHNYRSDLFFGKTRAEVAQQIKDFFTPGIVLSPDEIAELDEVLAND